MPYKIGGSIFLLHTSDLRPCIILPKNEYMIQRLIFLIVTLPFYGAAQTPFKDYIKNIPVRSIGPAVTSGRVTAIDVDEKGSGAIYLGAASGGVWKSTSGCIVWEPIFAQHPVLGIGSINVDPIHSHYFWVGTG